MLAQSTNNITSLERTTNKLYKVSNIVVFCVCILVIVLIVSFSIFAIKVYLNTNDQNISENKQYEKYLTRLMKESLIKLFGYNDRRFNYLSIGFISIYIISFALFIAILLNILQIIMCQIIASREQSQLNQLNDFIQQLITNADTIDALNTQNTNLQLQNTTNLSALQDKQNVLNSALNNNNIYNESYSLDTAHQLLEIISYIKSNPVFSTGDPLSIIQQNQQNQQNINDIMSQTQICNSTYNPIQLINALAPMLLPLFSGKQPKSTQLISKISSLNSYNLNNNIADQMLTGIQQINENIFSIQDMYNFLNYLTTQELPGQLPNESLFAYLDRMFNDIKTAQEAAIYNQLSLQSLQNKNALLKQLTNEYIDFFANNLQYVSSVSEMNSVVQNFLTQLTNIPQSSVLQYTPSTSHSLFNYIKSIEQNPNITSIMNSYSNISDNILQIKNTSAYEDYLNNLPKLLNLLIIQSKNPAALNTSESQKQLASLLSASIMGAQEDLNSSISTTINPTLHTINSSISKDTTINDSLELLTQTTETIKYAQVNNLSLQDQIEQENSNLSFITNVNNQLAAIFSNLLMIPQMTQFNSSLFNNNLIKNINALSQIPLNNLTNFYNQLIKISSSINQINSTSSSNFNVYTNNILAAIDSVYNNAKSLTDSNLNYAQNVDNLISLNQTINTEFTSGNPWDLDTRLQLNYEISQYIKDTQNLVPQDIDLNTINTIYNTYNSMYQPLQVLGEGFKQLTSNFQENGLLYDNIDKLLSGYISGFTVINNNIQNIQDNNNINQIFQNKYGTNDTSIQSDQQAISPSFDFVNLMNNTTINLITDQTGAVYPAIQYNEDQMSNLLSAPSSNLNIFQQWSNLTTLDKLLSLHNFLLLPSNPVGNNDPYDVNLNGNILAEHYTSANSRITNTILYSIYVILNNLNSSKVTPYSTSDFGTSVYNNWSNNSLEDVNLYLNNSYNLLVQYAKWKFYLNRLMNSKISDLLVNGYNTSSNSIDLGILPTIQNLIDIPTEYKGHNGDGTKELNNFMVQEYIDQVSDINTVIDITA